MRRSLSCALLAVWIVAGSGAWAADFYVAGDLVVSGVTADASGDNGFFPITGSDEDSSPGYGGAFGFGLGLEELAPTLLGMETPSIGLRLELEGVLGRDYELRSEGGGGFFTDVESWTVMTNAWLDLPVHAPVTRIFGRVPILDPLSIYAGGGIGLSSIDLATTDTVSEGSDSAARFSWQVGSGVAYEFTDWATITLGWRYLDLGQVETDLRFIGGGGPPASYSLDLGAHEFVSTLRFDFYSRPLEELAPSRWGLPERPRLRWPWGRSEGP